MRDLSGEEQSFAQEEPVAEIDLGEITAELGMLRERLDLFEHPAWAVLVAERTAQREEHYRALASTAITDIAAISVIRGQVAVLESFLSLPSATKARMSELDEKLRAAEHDQGGTDA